MKSIAEFIAAVENMTDVAEIVAYLRGKGFTILGHDTKEAILDDLHAWESVYGPKQA